MDTQYSIVDQLNSSTTSICHAYRVTFTQAETQFRSVPAPSFSALDLYLAFDANELSHRLLAAVLCVDSGNQHVKGEGE
ncbi:MAG: hypothetical protein ACREXJ_07180 [Gammaproteobacteria bacterium]